MNARYLLPDGLDLVAGQLVLREQLDRVLDVAGVHKVVAVKVWKGREGKLLLNKRTLTSQVINYSWILRTISASHLCIIMDFVPLRRFTRFRGLISQLPASWKYLRLINLPASGLLVNR